jgi:hypothetical protein
LSFERTIAVEDRLEGMNAMDGKKDVAASPKRRVASGEKGARSRTASSEPRSAVTEARAAPAAAGIGSAIAAERLGEAAARTGSTEIHSIAAAAAAAGDTPVEPAECPSAGSKPVAYLAFDRDRPIAGVDSASMFGSFGLAEIGRYWVGYTETSLQRAIATTEALSRCRTLPEVIEVQTDYLRSMIRDFFQQSMLLSKLSVKLTRDIR